MDIGKIIFELRKSKGMTQEKLAEMVGVSVPAVSKWETGSSLPDISLLSPIARALGTSVDYLLSYQLKLMEKDADNLLTGIKKECETIGFRQGMEKAFELLKEYPNSDYLKLKIANAGLSYAYSMENDYTEEEYFELTDKSIKLFKDLTVSNDVTISIAAKIALASRYMVTEKLEEAEQILLEELPKIDYNVKHMLPPLYLAKGELDKSLQLSQQALLQDLLDIRMDIMSMYSVKIKQGDYDKAICYAKNYRTLSNMYGNHFPSGADLMVNIYLKMKDVENALKWFEIYVNDIIEMNMDYSSTIYFDSISADIVIASTDMEDNVKKSLYKSILLNINTKYKVLKDKKEYKESMDKLEKYMKRME